MTKQQQQLAEEFVTLLETEQLEWKKGWSGISARPYNPVTGTVYHGVNRFRLLLTAPSDPAKQLEVKERKRTKLTSGNLDAV